MRTRRCFTALLVVGLLANGESALAASPSDDPFAQNAASADALLLRGVEHFKRQDYEAARVAFARSYELAPRTGTLLNLALAELQAGQPVAAVKHLRQFLRASDAPADKLELVRTKMLPRAEAMTARVQIDAPAGSDVLLDGAIVGRAPLSEVVDVQPGEHVVEVHLGANVQRLTTQAPLGSLTRVRVEIVAPQQTIQVRTTTPPMAPAPAAPASSPTREAPRDASWPTSKLATVAGLGGVALVGGVGGIIFSSLSSGDASRADSIRNTLAPGACYTLPGQTLSASCQQLHDTLDSQHAHYNLAIGFYVGGGIAAAGAVAAWLLWPKPPSEETRAWIAPMVGDAKGVTVGASW